MRAFHHTFGVSVSVTSCIGCSPMFSPSYSSIVNVLRQRRVYNSGRMSFFAKGVACRERRGMIRVIQVPKSGDPTQVGCYMIRVRQGLRLFLFELHEQTGPLSF